MRQKRGSSVFLIGLLLAALILGFRFHQPTQTGPIAAPGPGTNQRPDSHWRLATPAERRSAAASITAQLRAFGRNDYRTAVFYQSAALRKQFSSVDEFRQMMRVRYPEFARYKKAEFGPAHADQDGSTITIAAKVTGTNGRTVRAGYIMVREDHVYRVASVFEGGLERPAREINV